MWQGKLFPKPQLHKDLNGNIDKIDLFCMFKPSVRKYLCKLFFHPFCPHSLMLVQLEKQLVTSLQATWSRGNIYTLLRFRDLQGWEKAPGTGSSCLIALSVLLPACGTRLSGSRQGNTWLSPAPFQLGLFGLCIAIYPMVKEV